MQAAAMHALQRVMATHRLVTPRREPANAHLVTKHEKPCLVDVVWVVGIRVGELLALRVDAKQGRQSKGTARRAGGSVFAI